MSTLDPSAALFAGSAQTQATDLTLGLPLDALVAQLQVDDLLAAVVLPPQDGHDLLEILGQKIVAQLPPTVRPGETLLLQVTSLNANQIIVRNLGALDAEQPLPPQVVQAATADVPVPAQTPTPTPTPPAASVAPPRSVFVAASVVRAPLAEQSQSPPAPPTHTAIEARISAARAAAAPPIAQPAAGVRLSSTPSALPTPSALSAPPQRSVPPHITAHQSVTVPPRVLAAKGGTPEALLQAARVPQSSLMLSAARLASDAVRRLPEVFLRLEQALQPVVNDARTATLRTLVSFVTRLDPRNEEALPQQIASYVSNVLEGAEKKLTALIRAQVEAAAQPQEQTAPRIPQLFAEAKALERSAAIDYDVKSLVHSLISRPPAQHTPQLAQALRDAVITLSGAQLHVLQQNAQTPNALSFALPMFYHEGGQPAQIRIQRDAGKGTQTLDGDNFHVAFVLDTSTLGTVAVELQSAGRTVTVNVRTQSEREVPAFKSTLADLVTRLEKLRYRVARTSAQAAQVAAPQPQTALMARTTTVAKPNGLDLRA